MKGFFAFIKVKYRLYRKYQQYCKNKRFYLAVRFSDLAAFFYSTQFYILPCEIPVLPINSQKSTQIRAPPRQFINLLQNHN